MKKLPRTNRTCPICSKDFIVPITSTKRYCGNKCVVLSHTNKKIYRCPACDRPKTVHAARYDWYVKNMSLCKKCHMAKMRSQKGPTTEKQINTARELFKRSNPSYKPENKLKISNRMKSNNPTLDENVRTKIRLSVLKDLEEKYGKLCPNYNTNACQIIEEYGRRHGYNFQHALNGGEFYIKDLGYWVDGYDKEKNTVIEYYEKKHKTSVEKDLLRKIDIIKNLNCRFIEIKEWEN